MNKKNKKDEITITELERLLTSILNKVVEKDEKELKKNPQERKLKTAMDMRANNWSCKS